jgi:hypothetical protein
MDVEKIVEHIVSFYFSSCGSISGHETTVPGNNAVAYFGIIFDTGLLFIHQS